VRRMSNLVHIAPSDHQFSSGATSSGSPLVTSPDVLNRLATVSRIELPHSVVAEQNLLGSILADSMQWERVANLLQESDFFRPDHRLVWRAIATLQSLNTAVDPVTVAEHLTLGGELEAAGGLSYLGSLAKDTLLPSNAPTYADIIKFHANQRALIELGQDLSRGDGIPTEKIGRAMDTLRRIATTAVEQPPATVSLMCGSSVTMEPTHWLWHEWLACGSLQVFAGPAGLGKTTIALSLAAILTRGGLWPDGSRCSRLGSVIFWSGEDAIEKTLLPRFIAMGGDPAKIYFVDGVVNHYDGHREPREFDPSRDIPLLIDKANEVGDVRLLVIDPVSMCIAGDSNKNAEVRRGLAPLKTFAERHGAATLGISHFSKGTEGRDPLTRVTGSIAFGAAPRLVLSAVTETKKPDEPDDADPRHLFVRTKSNLGPSGDGFRYTVEQIALDDGITASRIVWGEHLKGGARELLAEAEHIDGDNDERSERDDAKQFLQSVLAAEPMTARQLFRDAREAGHSERTLRRAAMDLNVVKSKQGLRKGWIWSLPTNMATSRPEDLHSKTVATFEGSGHLRLAPQENYLPKMATHSEDAEDGHAGGVGKPGHLQDREAF
jgi:putative DNA primase/helicase